LREVNPANHTARVTARGADAKESGGANASFWLEPEGSGTKMQRVSATPSLRTLITTS
jgi:carbon monoxide dehydrogenase subunit G